MKHADASPALSYIRSLYAPEDALLQNIRATFEQRGMAIQVGAEEGKLLHMLIKLHQAKTVVEIGTLGGYSAIWMARALPAKGHLHTIEHEPAHAELARGFIRQSDVREKITVWEGKAQDVLKRIAETVPQVDAVFIDADKISYPHYLDWAESHLKPGGLLIADNTLLFGTVYLDSPPDEGDDNYPTVRQTTWQAMRDFNARLASGKHFDSVMLPTEQGLTVATRKEQNLAELI
jgi:predicted O-methyltransferase YrrM